MAEVLKSALNTAIPSVDCTYSVGIDNREVSIVSFDIETSHYKGTVDAQHPSGQWAEVRNPDGSVVTDSAVFPPLTQPGAATSWLASPTLQAQASNFQNPTFAWKVDGSGSSSSGNSAHTILSVSFPLSSTDKVLGKQSYVGLGVTDSDGATGRNSYTVRWHYPKENAVLAASGTPFWQEADRKDIIAYGYKDGSSVGMFGYSTYNDFFPTASTDMIAVGTGLVSNPWSAFVAAVGLTLSQIQPTQTMIYCNFDQCWNSPFSTGLPNSRDPALMNQYQMSPILVAQYQEQTWQYDQYDQHGYTGLGQEGIDHFTGKVQCAGAFGPDLKAPPGV